MARTINRDWDKIRKHCDKQRTAMEQDFNAIRPHLQEIAENFYHPAVKGLKEEADSNSDNGTKSDQSTTDLLDNHATSCLRRGAAGFHANLTSPSRQWFRVGTDDQNSDSKSAIRKHMDDRTDIITGIIRKSGTYKEFHVLYSHLLAFGFGTLIVLEDEERVIRPICLRMGTYALGNGKNGKVNRLVRRFNYTGAKMIQEFGDELPPAIKEKILLDGSLRFVVCNLIEPDRYGMAAADEMTKETKLHSSFQYRSIYWIADCKEGNQGILRVAGYRLNPIIAPRMDREHGDVYGIGRGHEALPLAKGLQATVYDSLQMSSHAAEPPVVASSDFASIGVNLERGGINFSGSGGSNEKSGIAPIDLGEGNAIRVTEYIQKRFEDKIGRAFYNDIFASISMMDNGKMTAAEVYQRTGESLLMLGPVLTSIDDEFLDPFINLVNAYAEEAGKIEVNPELAAQIKSLDIEYISSVHLAQKASELGVIDRYMSFNGNIAGINPAVLDNIDFDATTRLYGSMLGIKETCMTDQAIVEKNRKNRAAAAVQQQQAEQQLKIMDTQAKVGAVPIQGTVAGALAGAGQI
jgi:hypothetical protein